MNPTDYFTSLITPMLIHPNELRIIETHDDMGVLLTVQVHKDDMGVVIGKAGETANAMRLLVRIVGMRQNSRVSLKVNEPEGSDYYKRKRQ